MKKLVMGLFLILSTVMFAGWGTEILKDEFGDPLSKIATYSISDKGAYIIMLRESAIKGRYSCLFTVKENLGPKGKKTTIKIKIDDGKVKEYKGLLMGGRIASMYGDEKLVEEMKNGKIMKVAVYNYNMESILTKIDLTGFTKAFNEIKE